MFPVIQIGPVSLPTPELLLLSGFWLGSLLTDQKAKSFSVDPKLLERIIWWSLIAGVLGARLSYAARFPAAFRGEWLSLISINPAFLDTPAGIIIALSVSLFFISRDVSSFGVVLDGLTPIFSVMTSAVFLSQFVSGDGYGTVTTLPWGITLWGEIRHPVQLYFVFGSLLALSIILLPKSMDQTSPGNTFHKFAIITSGYLLILSFFQAYNLPTIYGFRLDQIFYWTILAIGLFLYANKKQINIPRTANEIEE